MMGECLVARCAARLANAIGSCPIRNLGDGEGGRGEQEGSMEEEDGGVGTLFGMEGWRVKGRGLINSLLCFSNSHFCPPHPHIPAGPSRHGKSSSTTSASPPTYCPILFSFTAPHNLVTFFSLQVFKLTLSFYSLFANLKKSEPTSIWNFFTPYFVT